MKLPAVNSIGWNIIKHAGYSMFLICILSYCCDLIQVLNAHAWTGLLPTVLYRTLSPSDQCMHWLVDELVFTDKWITSEATHRLVTLTNGVRVWQGKEEGVVLNECRKKKRGGRGWGFRMGHAEGRDFQVGLAGHVWPNKKCWGAFEGLDTAHLNPVVVYPPQQASGGIHHFHRGQVREALLPGHLWGPEGNVALVRSVSCLPVHAEADLVLKPRQELRQASGQTVSPCPYFPRHLRDCIDLSWFHSARGPAGFQVSNICHTEAPSAES